MGGLSNVFTTQHLCQYGWREEEAVWRGLSNTAKHSLCQQEWEEGGLFRWGLSNASEAWEREHSWPPDPMWAESNWPSGGVPKLELYQVRINAHHSLWHPACGVPMQSIPSWLPECKKWRKLSVRTRETAVGKYTYACC